MSEFIKAFSRQMGEHDLLKVEVPEVAGPDGKPFVFWLRPRLRVSDVKALGDMAILPSDTLALKLFETLGVDEAGAPLVNPKTREEYDDLDGRLIAKVVARCGIIESVFDQLEENKPPPSEGGEGKKT